MCISLGKKVWYMGGLFWEILVCFMQKPWRSYTIWRYWYNEDTWKSKHFRQPLTLPLIKFSMYKINMRLLACWGYSVLKKKPDDSPYPLRALLKRWRFDAGFGGVIYYVHTIWQKFLEMQLTFASSCNLETPRSIKWFF